VENIKILTIAPFLLVMYGCSSSSDSGTTITPTTPTLTPSTGLFLDAEVEGLSYTTDSGITGTTDKNGTYVFLPGENVSFSVGGVNIGTVAGAPVCTPFDFAAASTNIARFLQSLDADGDPSNGIDIVAANTALAGTTVSSDAFLAADAATFAADPNITAALAATGDTLIDEATAIANLTTGTDNTFETGELSGKLFVVLDPTNVDIGVMSFDGNGFVSSIFPEDTTSGGGDGSGFDENWVINASGQLVLTDPVEGFTTIVNRIGGSSRSITVTYSQDGAVALPASLLIPQAVTYDDLGGPSIGDTRTYDVVDSDGTPLSVVMTRSATDAVTYIVNANSNDTGTFTVGDIAPNIVTITDDGDPTSLTFMILLDGDPTVIDETTSVLFVGTTVLGGTPTDPDLEFNDIGVGSFTLKSVTTAP
jgi:hypothetical protein